MRHRGDWIVARWSSKKKEFFFYATEAIMCMKTNKKMTICPTKKRAFLQNDTIFTQNHMYLAETGSLFATFRVLRSEFIASKYRNSRHGRPKL